MNSPPDRIDHRQDHDLNRLGARVHVLMLDILNSTQTPWHETEREIEEKLEWGRLKAEQLAWVKGQMSRRLTKIERACIRLCFFQGLTYRQAGRKLEVYPSTVCRAVQRAVKILNKAAGKSKWGAGKGSDG